MTGDRRPKMSVLARYVRWAWDCMYPTLRIKGNEKRVLRRQVRHREKLEAWR